MADHVQRPTPIDIDRSLADPKAYEDVILKIFAKRSQRGQGYATAGPDVTYFDTAANRHGLARAIARAVADGRYTPEPVDLWVLETKGKQRCAHMPVFADHPQCAIPRPARRLLLPARDDQRRSIARPGRVHPSAS